MRGAHGLVRLVVLCGAMAAVLVAGSSVATVYEVKATKGDKYVDPALKALEKKLTRGAFSQWQRFEKLNPPTKSNVMLPLNKSVRVRLVPGSMSAILRGVSQFKGKKDRLTISLQLDDKKGTRLQDTTAKLDSGDSLLIVDGGLKLEGGDYIFGLRCVSK